MGRQCVQLGNGARAGDCCMLRRPHARTYSQAASASLLELDFLQGDDDPDLSD
jgi:hypothetical protein